ncbi:LOW QUALITY PROTEIN: E3 ubiquitin-protein ligase RBBP6-like [Gavia stellata]|uniref:LOW QUALITY PROTEIN: E3 ubiquitin-protein ligase RBBP6-like n=1 Tax=Gavia stellata TaxID=37040 RepID=UPI00289AFFE4|nr:LOW QUALITY PROTEIN: E3 ubiquitin-protein ligase RBBP6-like [Gavia stellata]
MSCVHYKFSSQLNYDMVTFDGLHISLCDLKHQIMGREKLKASNCDLQITNAQTKEEYTDDRALIPKNSSVIVRRIPAGGVKATSKTCVLAPKSHKILGTALRGRTEPVSGTLKATVNLAEANASEEEKIKAMMTQSCCAYDPINYMKKPLGPPPPSYTFFRCGKPGHYRKNCPRTRDKAFESVPRIKKSTGIPRSFMTEVKDPNTKGAMLTSTGKYAIPTINVEAYARGKKEKPPFLPEEPFSSTSSDDPIPDELLCLICKDIMTDAAVIPCCGNSFCDECIRTVLLDSEEHTCPMCHQTDVSPDSLIANQFLRKAVNNFKNGTGYTKRLRQQIQQPQQQQPPQPPPPLMRQAVTHNLQPLLRPTTSRQQDPPMIPLGSLASCSAAALSLLAPGQSSVAAGLPINQSTVVVSGLPPAVSLSPRAEKPDGPFGDADSVLPPAALVTTSELCKSSSLSISSLLEEEGYQVPVLRQPALPSLLGPQGQSISTSGVPMRASTIRSAGGGPGWELNSNRGHLHSERTQRTEAPALPASTPVFVPVPPPPLFPPPPHALPLPLGVPPPQFPAQFPPGQLPSAGYTVHPPGYLPAPANVSSAWVPRAVPTTQAAPLCREEFYREQQRLKEEEKKKSKLDEFTNGFAKDLMEYKKNQKERRCLFSGSTSPYRASSYSRSSYTCSKSRSGSSRSHSYSRSFSRSHCRSYLRSPPYPRRGKGKSCNHRSRSRSPPYRRYHSQSRSPVFRGRSPTKRTIPQGRKEVFYQIKEVPSYDMKAYYGRSVDFRDPFEKERYREWERNYSKWHEKFYKGYTVGTQPPALKRTSLSRENYSPHRFGPSGQENSPYAWGHREDYPDGQSHRNRNIARNDPEKLSGRESHGLKEPTKSKEKKVEYPLGDGKGNKHKEHRKRRKGDEKERFPNAELLEGARKPKESVTAEDVKTDSLFMHPSRDDATPVRDEPMEADSVAFKALPGKKKKEKAKPKAEIDKSKRKALVDYTSTTSPGGSPVRKTEEQPDTKQTVIKTMEEYHHDTTAPAEDVIVMIQVPRSKWDKDDSESEEEDIKSTRVPANENVSAKPPNTVKYNENKTEPLEETQKTTKEASYESSQRDAKSSRSSMSNEKGKTKDQDHSLSGKDTSEKRKCSVQQEEDHSGHATEEGNGKNISQSSKFRRSSEKHDTGCASTATDITLNRDKKSDHDGNRDHSSSKCRDEKSELARRKDSPSRNTEPTSIQRSKLRDERAEPSKKGAEDVKRSSYVPPHEQKQSDHKAAHDSKCILEEHKPLDKNSGKEKEKHVPEVKGNKEKEPDGNKPPLRDESPGVRNEKENVTGQNDRSVVKPKPQVSGSSWLSSDLIRETDEAVIVPDYSESDSESNVSAKDEEAAGKNPKEPKEKAVDRAEEDTAAPAAVEQPEASQSQSSPSVSRSYSQSPFESQARRHSSSASSGERQDSKKKKKKKEKKKHKEHKKHKKHKKHIGNETELEKSQKHQRKKKKSKKSKDKDGQKVKSVTT